MDIIIRPAETSDFDSVVHIMNQVQALHVNWRPDIYKESKDFFSLDAFRALDKEAFMFRITVEFGYAFKFLMLRIKRNRYVRYCCCI